MKKTLLTILALVFIAHVADAKSKKHHKANGKEILSVSVRHGGCFGRCPQYTIEVDKNGTVTYTGIRYTKDSGVYKKNVGVAKVKALFDEFNTYRVDTCSKVYTNRIPDLSGIYYTIVYKGVTQTIGNANFGPVFFNKLTSEMSSIAVVDSTWKKEQ